MEARLRSWWQKIRKPLGVVGIIAACVLLIALIVAIIGGYFFNWEWTGVSGGVNKVTTTMTTPVTTATPETTVAIEQPPAKTIWDWLGLLGVLAIPVVVGFGAAWFTAQQGKVSERENKDNQREKALQDYIDSMSELLLEKNLRDSSPEDEVRKIARVRTLTVLRGLDTLRKVSVLQFLYESDLIENVENVRTHKNFDFDLDSISILNGADLSRVDLRGVYLRGADLSGANMSGANLSGVTLSRSILGGVNLSGADLSGADLSNADLGGVTRGSGVDKYGDSVIRQLLSGANLNGANLRGAKVTAEQLDEAESLAGATMPDGSIHP